METAVEPTRLDDLPDLITLDEAAAVLRVSRTTVYDLTRSGWLPSLRIGAKSIRIRKADLEALAAAARQEEQE